VFFLTACCQLLNGAPAYILMFADLIVLLHFAVNSPMKFRNSNGEVANGTPPRSAILAANFRSARAKLICLLSFFDDLGGGVRGYGNPLPISLISRHDFRNSRDVRQYLDTGWRRNTQGPSSFDMICPIDVTRGSNMT
jgi:hypothetical protein